MWTVAVVAELVEQSGVSRATLYRDRRTVLARLAEEEKSSLEERRAAFLSELRIVREEARIGGQFATVARMMAMEASLLGLDRVPLPDVPEEEGEVDTSLEGVLRDVRRMRRQAQAGHSYVAADRLLQREHALIGDIRRRDEDAAARALSHVGMDEKTMQVAELMRMLPDSIRQQVLSML